MENNFKVGDRIGTIPTKCDWEGVANARFGVVAGTSQEGKILVKLDGWSSQYEYDPKDIDFENNIKPKSLAIEEEFKNLQKEIREKIQVAGDMLKQSAKLAEDNGYSLRHIEALYPLLNVMNDLGWETSSLQC